MALQPASGARDLLPRDVGVNRWIAEQLAAVYKRWGYEEVTPPSLERIDTLEAGGAIQSHQVVQVVADEALGLRPEMTASIARAASTRLAAMQRPLRLHYRGSTFQAQRAEDQGLRIVEDLQSGVELMGANGIAGDAELLRLLLDAGSHLPLSAEHQPTLLIGHQRLLSVLLEAVEPALRSTVRRHVCGLNRVALSHLELPEQQRLQLLQLLQLRGEPTAVIQGLEALLGPTDLLAELKGLISIIEEQACSSMMLISPFNSASRSVGPSSASSPWITAVGSPRSCSNCSNCKRCCSGSSKWERATRLSPHTWRRTVLRSAGSTASSSTDSSR